MNISLSSMTEISVQTKIGFILKQNPEALEAIISLSPKFNKLRNPLLRKLIASRASIGMASKIGGCTPEDFFRKLQPLGFTIDRSVADIETNSPDAKPAFMSTLQEKTTVVLDVRADVEVGKDPLQLIMKQLKSLPEGHVLKLINSFEPIPLIEILGKQGYQSYSELISEDESHTYFLKSVSAESLGETDPDRGANWDELLSRYANKLVEVDVRHLEMPLPMLTILDALENLPEDKALYVHHKRIPVFLLPELRKKGLDYRIKEMNESEVFILIFKP